MRLLLQCAFVLVLVGVAEVCHASVWPVFSAPGQSFLIVNQLVSFDGCPNGQARLIDGVRVKVRELCETYCPESWEWVAKSDGRCHALDEFDVRRYEIFYVEDGDGVLGSVVSALSDGGEFVFESPEKEHWYCVEMKSAGGVTCANDV